MRIAEIHIYQKDLPVVDGPYTWSNHSLESIDSTIIKLVSDTGLIGWGETAPLGTTYQPQHAKGARAALVEMAPGLIGQSPLTPRLLYRHMDKLLMGHNYAKAAIDVAAFDLAGKNFDVPVFDLLGGSKVDRVPAYYAIGLQSPEDTAHIASERAAMGYQRIQLKVGGRDLSEDIAAIHKVWETVGMRVKLLADANRALTASDTLKLSIACSHIPLTLEQPCRSMEEIASIRTQVNHPLLLDENTESPEHVLRAIATGICDGFGLKMTRLGGLTPFSTVRDMCAMRAMPHTCEDSWGGDIIAAACIHMAATIEQHLLEGVWTAGTYIEQHYDAKNSVRVKEGFFNVPQGSGLGLMIDENQFGNPVASFG